MNDVRKTQYFLTGKSGTIGKYMSSYGHATHFDITKESEVVKWFQSQDVKNRLFLHLAAIVGESKVSQDLEYAKKVNVEGAVSVAKMALESEMRGFVFVSTSHVYKPKSEKISEDAEIEPQNHYANLKREAEEKIVEIFKNSSTELIILRVFSVLDFYTDEFTLGGRVTKAIERSQKITIANSLDKRDFLTPKSVAQAIEFCIEENLEGGIYNLCSGQSQTVRDAVQRMLVKASLSKDWLNFDENYSISPAVCGSNSKVINALPGLKPLLKWQLSEFRG